MMTGATGPQLLYQGSCDRLYPVRGRPCVQGARYFGPVVSNSDDSNPNHPAVVQDATAITEGLPVAIPLSASDADGNALNLRIVAQPANGTVALAGTIATYYPAVGFAGTDVFTFSAWDGETDSNLGTATVTVSWDDTIFYNGFDVP